MDRGKVMTAEELEAGRNFGRYLDVDGDAIPYRTYPGTHASRGSFFTRGTSRDEYARYTEAGEAYQRNMERLLVKWETAKTLIPPAIRQNAPRPTRYGAIHYGSTSPAMGEAADLLLAGHGIDIDLLRVRGFPFGPEVAAFIAEHDRVFVIEQNRDGQLRSLLINECEIDPARLVRVLHYNGAPITAAFIARGIAAALSPALREAAQ
jgi:2-oxoglutarate ferredoxin oxidoreductase subunit alpha